MKAKTYLTVHTPLDAAVKRDRKFHLKSVVGEEEICNDFSFTLHLCSLERLTNNDVRQLTGESISVALAWTDQKGVKRTRYINGIVYFVTELGMSRAPLTPDIWQYEIEISSWFKKLETIKDSRIFQKNGNTGLRLIADLLREYDLIDFKIETSGRHPRRDFVVMYDETIGHFIRRLLLEDGIVWRFEHHETKHVMLFSDNSQLAPQIPTNEIGRYDGIRSFCKKTSYHPIKLCTQASFAWESPPVKQISRRLGNSKGKLSHYVYSGRFGNQAAGEQIVKKQHHSLKSYANRFQGESNIRALMAGKQIMLDTPLLNDLTDRSYLLQTVKINATEKSYSNTFLAIPADQPFFPYESLNRFQTSIAGPQTATVVGEGEPGSVQTDRLGRVKVRFHWDHYSPKPSSRTSAYLRVAMPAAGNQRGFLFNPRIGEEVVVDFEDGDPDKPFIIGSVYSKNNPPAFSPNTRPFTSIIKNTADKNSNQVVFDDQPAAETLTVVARKQMDVRVNQNMNIDVTKDIIIDSTAIYILSKTGIDIKADGEINHMSLATILNVAALTNTNTAGGNVNNLAAGMVKQEAGGILTNLAGALYANTAVLGITQSAAEKVDHASQLLMLNTAGTVVNAAEKTVENKAGLAVLNKAGTDLVHKGKTGKNKITLMSTTEAATFVITGKTNVGP